MELSVYFETIASESALLAKTSSLVPLETPVPSCPGWTMGDLVGHIGMVQRWVTGLLQARAQERPAKNVTPIPKGPEVIPWFCDATVALLAKLSQVDPAAEVWTWTPERHAGYWWRRQAHEVAIHRWDAQNATGHAAPLEDVLAVDGVDELLTLQQAVHGEKFKGVGETVHLHCTNAPGEWLLRLGRHGLEVEHVHAKGDVAARGSASDLDLFVWGRVPSSGLEVFGNTALLDRFQALTAM